MHKDRIEGAAKQAKGAIKEAAGKVTGDARLKAEGAADKLEGKVQNAVGGAPFGHEAVAGGARCILRAAAADELSRALVPPQDAVRDALKH